MSKEDKNLVLLGVSGGIALYKSIEILREFIKKDFDVQVIMTSNAAKFITPLTFSALSGHSVILDIFSSESGIRHIDTTKKSNLFLCAPATANLLGKLASGIADDALTTIALACTCPKVLVPAMNTNMWLNPIVQKNIEILGKSGYEILSPVSGALACGDSGPGRMEETENIISFCMDLLTPVKFFSGKTILITAGRTEEMIDSVRYISNRSSGKMGFALARQAKAMGAKVILIYGKTSLPPPNVDIVIPVVSAEEMHNVVLNNFKNADIIIKSAAVSDYRPETVFSGKIKKTEEKINLTLVKNPDILKELGRIKEDYQYLAGFAAETDNILNSAELKLKDKKLNLIIANDVSQKNIGFDSDKNKIILIDKNNNMKSLPVLSKDKAAREILQKIANDLGINYGL